MPGYELFNWKGTPYGYLVLWADGPAGYGFYDEKSMWQEIEAGAVESEGNTDELIAKWKKILTDLRMNEVVKNIEFNDIISIEKVPFRSFRGDGKGNFPEFPYNQDSNENDGRKYYANGGGIVKEYKLRAEGINDFINFLGTGIYFDIKWFKVETTSGPDVIVTFSTNLSLKQIKSNLEQVQDSHVMLDTVKPVNQYTGERYSNGGGIGTKLNYEIGGL